MPLTFLLTMLFYRYCYYQGAKRVMGGFTGLMCGVVFSVFGLFMIRSSRLLLDEKAAAALEEKLSG